MRAALFWSGGKDSLLALDRAQQRGLDVTHLVNIFHGETGRVRFHGVRAELIEAQARALRKGLWQRATTSSGFEATFLAVLEELRGDGFEAVVFGNIHLADVRGWYEERTARLGFRHAEPLWGDKPAELLEEFIARKHRSMITSIYLGHGGRREWLGREFSPELFSELANCGADICGERGEYHSFCFAGPLFTTPVRFRAVGEFEAEQHLMLELELMDEATIRRVPGET